MGVFSPSPTAGTQSVLVNYDENYPDFTINDGKFHHNMMINDG
jgi:hypothetical protein